MSSELKIVVNGQPHLVEAPADTPLLYVLRNELGLNGPRFGCGLAQCGACTVHLGGEAIRSCITPVAKAAGAPITTLEGLGPAYAHAAGRPAETLHPLQAAFVEEEAAQCGYCSNGWIMNGAALLAHKPHPTDAEIRVGLSGLKCRCGCQMSILRAVKRAASGVA